MRADNICFFVQQYLTPIARVQPLPCTYITELNIQINMVTSKCFNSLNYNYRK